MVNINLQQELNGNEFIVYAIKNLINNKIYIGQTTNYVERFRAHLRCFSKNVNSPLYLAMNKYGLNYFEFFIIDIAKSIKELNELEILHISNYKSNNCKYGYNIAFGGMNSLQSSEWIDKRIAKAGSENAKKYGKIKTDEEKTYLSDNSPKFWLGKTRSDETKAKVSTTKKAHGLLPPNTKKVGKFCAKTDKLLETYLSTTDAGRKNDGISQSKISRICNGISKNKGEFIWKFI